MGNKVTMGYYLSSDSVIDSPQHMEGTQQILKEEDAFARRQWSDVKPLGPGTIPHGKQERERRQSSDKA